MIIYSSGDIFSMNVEAIVNPVNYNGVMGAGLAKQFKERYPDNFNKYVEKCKNGELLPGTLFVYPTGGYPRYVVNFPSKNSWRNKSTLEFIENGLVSLVIWMQENEIEDIAIPMLGCGLGGLKKSDVCNLFEKHLSLLKTVCYVLNTNPVVSFSQ